LFVRIDKNDQVIEIIDAKSLVRRLTPEIAKLFYKVDAENAIIGDFVTVQGRKAVVDEAKKTAKLAEQAEKERLEKEAEDLKKQEKNQTRTFVFRGETVEDLRQELNRFVRRLSKII
jgi:hypothetical protein